MNSIITTSRLVLRHATMEDAAFILRLLNEPSWLKFIGDRGVHTLEQASAYVAERFIAIYHRLGYGFFVVERRDEAGPIGICGLIKRTGLEDADLGFAFLPEFWKSGFAYEASAAVIDYAREKLQIKRLAAISAVGNESAGRLLEKLKFRFEKLIRVTPESDEVRLFVRDPL